MLERTFVMIKPDGTASIEAMTAIFTRLSTEAGLKIDTNFDVRFETLTEERVRDLYPKYGRLEEDPDWWPGYMEYMMSGPVIKMVWVGEDAQRRVRELVGATRPWEAEPGTIREKFGRKDPDMTTNNTVHCTDHEETNAFETEVGWADIAVVA